MEQLGGVEADGGDVAPLQYRAAFEQGAEGMGAVVDDLQAVALGDLLQAADVAGIAEHVGGDDGRGVRLDGGFDVGRIQVPGFGWMSANTGRIPSQCRVLVVATKLNGVVMALPVRPRAR